MKCMTDPIAICTGNSRNALVWHAGQITFDELFQRLSVPIRTAENAEQYRRMTKQQRAEAKDHGGFMAGTLKGTRRKAEEVVSRSMITLDADKLQPGFFDEYEIDHDYLSIVYTTHSHTPSLPRARILIPVTRNMSPEEAIAVSRYLASDIGMEMIDPCSFRVNQLMYWPTCPSDGEYICRKYEGEILDPDKFLSARPAWRNITELPRTPGETADMARQQKKQEDPLAKDGIVGDYCRTHSISDVMEHELSDIYEPADVPGRYHYKASDSIAGVVVYDDKFAYSHHASDPACGLLLNAFDLVRIHKFGNEDPKKSFNLMAEYASKDEAVRAEAMKRRQAEAADDFSDVSTEGTEDESWKKKLQYAEKSTELVNCLRNVRLIMQNDPMLKNIVYNQLADGLEIRGKVPWKHEARFWRDADDAQLICYIDDNYGSFSQRYYDVAVSKVADDRSYHPIREYFDRLPKWDGIPRVDTCIIDYLGAQDNGYVRAATRKTLCAALRRIKSPGTKFDYMPVLNGPQGIGKSTFISKLGMEWYSDSLNISDMNDKTAAEKLQGFWIIEIGELAGMKKADLDKVKAFISRQDDKYRASFGRRVTPHPRQCIFFGTTNSENGYLRDITGNRRYWNIKVSGDGRYHSWDLDQETVDQIWAEVKVLESDEKLYLSPELEGMAQGEQREAMERDDREGLVREYLDTLLPEDWDEMDTGRRREFLLNENSPKDPTQPKQGTVKRMTVSNIEIWCECFGNRKEEIRPADSYAISAIMVRIEGWKKNDERVRLPLYGRQRIYERVK